MIPVTLIFTSKEGWFIDCIEEEYLPVLPPIGCGVEIELVTLVGGYESTWKTLKKHFKFYPDTGIVRGYELTRFGLSECDNGKMKYNIIIEVVNQNKEPIDSIN